MGATVPVGSENILVNYSIKMFDSIIIQIK